MVLARTAGSPRERVQGGQIEASLRQDKITIDNPVIPRSRHFSRGHNAPVHSLCSLCAWTSRGRLVCSQVSDEERARVQPDTVTEELPWHTRAMETANSSVNPS